MAEKKVSAAEPDKKGIVGEFVDESEFPVERRRGKYSGILDQCRKIPEGKVLRVDKAKVNVASLRASIRKTYGLGNYEIRLSLGYVYIKKKD